ncbi:MAG: YsnF/AvaK domain-containing protein [Sphingomicrobium sp.]
MVDKDIVASRKRQDDAQSTEEVAAIPLVEERLNISKRSVETGRVRVHVNVDERTENVTEQLRRDDVEVERIPRNIPLSEMPLVRLEGTTTVVPVVEEVLVVEKRLMLVEEIHIRRRSGVERREIPVILKTERAEIERQEVARDLSAEGSANV